MRCVDRLLAALSLLALALAAVAQPVTVRDGRDRMLTLPAPPQRIVSMLPSITETVCALGGCARLVGVDRFSNWPAEVARLPQLGGLDDAQLERLVALKPDVVLLPKSSRIIDRLEALGQRVLVFESQSHADVQRSLAAVAQLLGEPSRGTEAWARVVAQIEAAAARVPPALRGRKVYFEVASAPYTAGEASFIGETLRLMGLANAVPASLGPFPKLNPEFVVRAQPDLVLVSQRELATMRERPGWSGLRALQAGQACGFDSVRYEILVRPGPRIGEAAGYIADCLVALPAAPSSSAPR